MRVFSCLSQFVAANPLRAARKHSMAWVASVCAVLAIATVGSGAMPQGVRDSRVKAKHSSLDKAGRILAQTEFELTGQQVVVGPGTQPVPRNQETALTTTLYGAAPESLNPNYRVRGMLSGPSLTAPLQVEAPIGENVRIPPLSRSGHHDVSALRIVDVTTGATIDSIAVSVQGSTPENPVAVCSIDVLEQLLVSEVDVHEMTYEEIVQAGISIDDDSYTYYNFALGLSTTSNGVPLNIPVALPPPDRPDPRPIAPVRVVDMPDGRPYFIQPVFLTVEDDDDDSNGTELEFDGRPITIPGVIVIPGQVGVLNQHFEATLVVSNGAPAGAPNSLVVRDISAMIELPDAGTPNDPSDDPLRVPPTQQGGQVTTLPVHALGPDGEYGTSDDSATLRPGDAGQASFLVEGLEEGLHTIDFNLEGTLEGLPIGPVTVKSRVPGSVLVRDRRFAVTFTHPDVVREGQEYEFGLTMTNTSENVTIQQALVTLSPAMISGATLLGINDSERMMTAIPPGGSRTVTWRLRSNTTGRVTAGYGKVGADIENGLSLSLGVGDRNVPLSPDSLILPGAVRFLPDPFVEASRALLGQAWSVANAPPALLPAGVTRVHAQAVADRAAELGTSGLRAEFGEPLTTSIATLARDWIGEQQETPDAGFSEVLRDTVAGDAWFDALGEQLYHRLVSGTPSVSPADLHRELAEAEMARSPMVSALVSQTPGTTSLAGGRLIDSQGHITGFLATPGERMSRNPLAGAARIADDDAAAGAGASAGQFMFASRVDNMPWTFELSGWSTGTVDVSLVVPATVRAANRVVFSGISVTAGSRHRVVTRPFAGSTFTLEVWQGNAWQPSGIAASVVRFEDPAPRLLGAEQISPDLIAGGDKYGRLVGLLFSKPMSALQADVASRYTIGGGELVSTGEIVGAPIGVNSAKSFFGNRMVILALKAPIGPYIHRTVAVSGLVDTRGVPVVGGSSVDIGARVSSNGNPPGGWATGRVLKATGEPVANADVLYWTRFCGDDEFEANDNPSGPKLITVVKTDANGRYSIDYVRNSSCGAVQLEGRAPDGNGLKKRTAPVVFDGQHLDVDLVFLARGSVQGTVRRFDNTPAPYAWVAIMPSLDVTGSRTVQADASGFYRADQVPVGTFSVKSVGHGADATASGLAAGAIEEPNGVATVNVTLQNTTGRVSGTVRYGADPDRPVQVFVSAIANIPGFGDRLVGWDLLESDHDFVIDNIPVGSVRVEVSDIYGPLLAHQNVVLTESNPTVSGMTFVLASLGAIEGRVVNDLGNPLGNVIVRGGVTAVLTNAFGEYHIPDVRPGNHVVTATQVGSGLTGSIDVTVQDATTVTGATIVIATPSTISGRVQLERNGTTTPVAGAYVSVDGSNLAVTNAQGYYTLRNVVGQRAYTLRAVHPNGLIGLNQHIVVGHAESIARDVTFRPGKLLGTIYQPNGSPATATVSVTVKRPVTDAGANFGLLTSVSVNPSAGATTGAYVVDDVNPGVFNVRASSGLFNNGRPVIKGGTVDSGETETCDLTLVETFGGSVRGLITRPDGTPAGADIDVTLGGGSLADVTVRTIADGTYAFPEVFSAGNYSVTALDRTTAKTSQTRIALRQNQDTEVNLKLLGRGTLRVSVVDGAGNPVTGGSVTIDGSAYPRNHGFANVPPGGGAVSFPGISEGPYAVSATWNGLSGRVSVFVANGVTVDVTVQLQSSGTVTGRVFAPDGITPIGLADVELQIGNRIVGVAVTSDADEDRGTFRFEHVPASSYRIEAFDNRSGRSGASGGTLATQGQVTYTAIRMVPTGTVTGVVTSNGNPSVHATVTIQAGESGLNSTSLTATTDNVGGFIFTGIPEGAVRLTASAAGGLTGATNAELIGPPGQPLSVVANVELTPSVTVEGVVRAHGATTVVAGARITLRIGNRNFITTTLADGSYRIPYVPLGSFVVWATAPVGYDRGEAATVVADTPGATHTVDIEMSGVGSIVGTARTNTGALVTNGTVKLVNDAWYSSRGVTVSISVPVQANGTYRVDNAPAGPMSLRLTVPGDARVGANTGTVVAAQTSTVDVDLENAGSVTGTVMLPDAVGPAPGSDVTVKLSRTGKPTLNFYTHTTSTGTFRVDNVPLGSVNVTINDAATGGVAYGSGQLDTNAQTIDVGTLTLDDELIHVVSIDPVDGSTSVPRNTVVRVTFSEPALPSSIKLQTMQIGIPIYGQIGSTATLAPDGMSATITRSTPWDEFQLYIVGVSGVKDLAGRTMEQSFVSSFTTIDETPPYAWLPWPRNGMTGMPLDQVVDLTFNETLSANQDFSAVMKLAPQSDPTAFVAGAVTHHTGFQSTLRFTPSQPLEQFTTYVISASGARDVYGLTQVAPYASTFKTRDATPPVIDPIAIDGTSVATARPTITVTYSDSMIGVSTGTGTNLKVDGVTVPATTKTATTMTGMPASNLSAGTHTVVATVTDSHGNVATRNASFVIENSLPTISAFTISGSPAVDGMTVTQSLSPSYSAQFSAPSGINTSQTRLLVGQGTNTPVQVAATVTGTTLSYQTPGNLAAGAYTAELIVVDNLGNSVSSGVIHFTLSPDAADIQSATPSNGSQHGGTTVVLSGNRLLNSTGTLPTVRVSGTPAQVISGTTGTPNTLTIVMPAGTPGPALISISSDRGTGSSSSVFTYTAASGSPFAVEADTRLLWHLDEAANGAVGLLDAGPLSIDGTGNSTSLSVDGRFGRARSLVKAMGDDDLGQLAFGSGSFTVEAWMKTTPLPAGSANQIVSRSHPIYAYEEYGINVDAAGNLTAFLNPATGTAIQAVMPSTAYDVDDGAWHAVAMVVNRESAKVELYVDGQLRQDATIPAGFGPVWNYAGTRLSVGNRIGGASAFPGAVDEVRVSVGARSAEQIAAAVSGSGVPVVTRVAPTRFVQRGVATTIVVEGYGFTNASVTAAGPGGVPVSVQVVSQSATKATLVLMAETTVPLGDGELTIMSADGTATTVLTIADQSPFAVESDTRLLWHLDEASNGAVGLLDAGPLSIDGTGNSTSLSVDGRFGKARSLVKATGDDDLGQLAFGSGSFTVEAWVKTTPLPAGSANQIVSRSHPIYAYEEYGINLDAAGNLTAFLNPATGTAIQAVMPATAYDVDDGAWHAVAMVVNRESAKVELYVDGQLRQDATIPAGFGPVWNYAGTRLSVGNRIGGASAFPGAVDEVRVSAGARSAEQIAANVNGTGVLVVTRVAPTRFVQRGVATTIMVEGYGLTSASVTAAGPGGAPVSVHVVSQSATKMTLVITAATTVSLGDGTLTVTSTEGTASVPLTVVEQTAFAVEADTRLLWHMDETAGPSARILDSGPLSIDGTDYGIGPVSVDGRFGKARKPTLVTADDDVGQLTFGSGSFTVEAWIKTTPLSGTQAFQIAGRSGAGYGQEYGITLDAAGNLTAKLSPASGTAVLAVMPATACDVDDDTWHYLAMVVNRETSKLELYVDGVLRKDADIPVGFGPVLVQSGARFKPGAPMTSAGTLFTGAIDEVRVSSTAHSATQIEAMANGAGTPVVLGALPKAAVQRGSGAVPLTLTGYGLLGVSVVPLHPQVTVNVVSSTVDRCELTIDAPASTPLGPMQLSVTDVFGQTTTTTIDVVDQKPFANSNQSSYETALLWHLDETGAGNVTVTGAGDPGPTVLGGVASTASTAVAGRFAPAGAPANTGGRGSLYVTGDADSGHLAMGSGSFTVETWFKTGPLAAATSYQLIGRSTSNPGTSSQEYSILLDAKGKLSAQIYQTNTTLVTAAMSPYALGVDDNEWHYVAMVVNRTTGKLELYVDGALRAETAIPGTFGAIRTISGSRLYLGLKLGANLSAFPGAIDEVRILRYAAPASQIRDTWLGISTTGKHGGEQ